jgi:hypothetical protein
LSVKYTEEAESDLAHALSSLMDEGMSEVATELLERLTSVVRLTRVAHGSELAGGFSSRRPTACPTPQ